MVIFVENSFSVDALSSQTQLPSVQDLSSLTFYPMANMAATKNIDLKRNF